MAARIILVEAWPRRIADGVAEPVRLAGGGSAKPYRYNNQRWLAGIAALPTIIAGLSFDGDNLGAGAIPQALEFSWASTKASDLTSLASGYLWPDAAVTIRVGPEGALPPVVLTGKVVDASSADGQLRIVLADPAAALRLPVLTDRFAGNGGLEGPEEWNGRIKRRAWGRVWNVEGEPINPANNIYCFADPRRPIASIDTVRDSGAPAAALTSIAWQGTADATWAALLAAVAPQGGGVVAPSIACVKWWTEPAGTFTADLRGEISTGYVETAPEIAARLVEARNGPPFVTGAIVAAKALRPAPCGVLVERDTETVAAVLDSLLGGVSLIWRLDAAGSIDFRTWSWTAPVASVRSHQITRRNTFKPVKSRKIGYRANQTMMSRGDIAGIVFASDISFADGSSLPAALITYADGNNAEALKPYEPNATAGAVIPDPSTYVPGDPHPGYIRDTAGNVRAPGELLNSSIELTPGGLMQYRDLPSANPVKLGELELPALGAAAASAVNEAADDIDQLASALVLALDQVSRLSQTVTRAGIRVDPANGNVVIDALEATRERVNTAEIRLNAQDASIRLKASTSYVDQRIALAVLDPSQIADLEDVYLRLGEAEIAIEGLTGSISLLATTLELSALAGRVSTAEVDIDSLKGQIALKVNTTTFDALADRVSDAELSISSLGDIGEIVLQVGATRLLADDLADNEEALLLSMLDGDRKRRSLASGIASGRQELTALVNDAVGAETRSRQALQVQFGAQSAVFASQIQLLANADISFAEQLSVLSASIDDQFEAIEGAIEEAAQVSLDRDNLLSATLSQQVSLGRVLEGDVSDQADSLLEALVRGELTRIKIAGEIAASRQEMTAQIIPQISALVERVSAIIARVSGSEADIVRQETVFTNATSALAGQITTFNATLGGRIDEEVAGLQQQVQEEADARIQAIIDEAQARGEALSAEEQARIEQIEAERDARITAIAEERSAREAEIERIEQVIVEGDNLIAAGLRDQVSVGRGLDGEVAEAADQLLLSILQRDEARRRLAGQIAAARSEMTAEIADGKSNVAQLTDLLISRIAGAEASIIDQSRVVTSLSGSTAQRFLEVRSEFSQSISAEASTRTSQIAAETDARIDGLNALTDGLNSTIGRLTDEELARLQGDQEEASARTAALAAEAQARSAAINDTADGLILQIENEAQARGEALTAEQQARIAAINAERDARLAEIEAARVALLGAIAASEAAVRDEIIAQTGPGSALAGRVTAVETRVGDNEAAVEAFAESLDGVAARGGLRFDVNGRVTGIGVTATAATTLFSALVDAFELVDPVSGFKYLAATPEGVRLRNVEVDTLKAGIVSATKMTGAAMGETAFAYAEPGVNTDGFNWVNIISVGLTPINARPTKLMFSALIRDTTDANTVIKVRIIRDDGAIIYGESARRTGAHLNITDEGVPVCIPIVDNVASGRATTWTFQMAKVNEQNVVCEASFRFAQAEELSRVNTQASSIVLGGGSGGEPGPGVPPTNPPGGGITPPELEE